MLSLSIAFAILTSLVHCGPIVDLGYVKYEGLTNATAGINYYRGIRYAKSPTGKLRWKAPVPIEDDNTYYGQTLDASSYGPACYQSTAWLPIPPTLFAPYGESEDCLLLDVLAPTNPFSASLPVMVMIHAGGYILGASTLVPGEAIVNRSEGGLIWVQMQYRLGMFGFLGGSDVAKHGDRNAALLDQRAALEWVQKHIHKFGGDPSKVTIIGNYDNCASLTIGGSSGGGSVTYQLMAKGGLGVPPFRAAIAEYPWWQNFLDDPSQELQYSNVLSLANCDDLKCLRSLPITTLKTVQQQSYGLGYRQPGYTYGVFYYGPVVDGEFLIELPDQAYKGGRFFDVPIIVDHNKFEGFIYVNSSITAQDGAATNARILFPRAGETFFSHLFQLYPAANFISTFWQTVAWFGDWIINCNFPKNVTDLGPTYYVATAAVDRNSNSSAVFKMWFGAGSTFHGASGPFLFSNTTTLPSSQAVHPNTTLAEILVSYFISFAVTKDPNILRTPNAPFWPSYASGGAGNVANGESIGFTVLNVTDTDIKTSKDGDVSAQCDFWSSHGLDIRN